MRKYYQIVTENSEANIYIYGDIVSWEWLESDVSSYTLAKEIEGLDVDRINVYINSYGGEVAEGLAIYNALKRHKAKVVTYDDGFACSAASVVFVAGDERVMSNASLLFIHNAWSWTAGDANQMRKDADELETITQASINAYMSVVNIEEEELKEMMDEETWLLPEQALEMGFATSIANEEPKAANQSAKKHIVQMILSAQQAQQKPSATINIDANSIADIVIANLEEKFTALEGVIVNRLDDGKPAVKEPAPQQTQEPSSKQEPKEPEPQQSQEPNEPEPKEPQQVQQPEKNIPKKLFAALLR